MLKIIGGGLVYFACFDGLTSESNDYYDASYSFAGSEKLRMKGNELIRDGLKEMSDMIVIEMVFMTPSVY